MKQIIKCTFGKHDWNPIRNARWFDERTWNSCKCCVTERLVDNPGQYVKRGSNFYKVEKDDKGRLIARCHSGWWLVGLGEVTGQV